MGSFDMTLYVLASYDHLFMGLCGSATHNTLKTPALIPTAGFFIRSNDVHALLHPIKAKDEPGFLDTC